MANCSTRALAVAAILLMDPLVAQAQPETPEDTAPPVGERAPETPPDEAAPEAPPDEAAPEAPAEDPDEPLPEPETPEPEPPTSSPATESASPSDSVASFPRSSPAAPPPSSAPVPPPSSAPDAASPALAAPSPAPAAAPTDPRGGDWGLATESSSGEEQKSEPDRRALRLGPIVGGGLPNLLSFGGQIKVTRFFGAGINVGLIPSVRIDYYGQATLKYQEYDAYGHLYPFGNAFFLGAGVGYETVTGVFSDEVDLSAYAGVDPSLPASITLRSEGSVQTMVLTPQLGLFKTFKSGFSIGVDAGAQIPIAPSEVKFATEVPSSVPQTIVRERVEPNDEEVRQTLEKIGQTPLPTFNLRIGWLL